MSVPFLGDPFLPYDGSSSREEEELQEAYNCAEFLQRFEMAAELADTFSYSVEEVPGLVQYAPLQDTYHVKSGQAGKFKVILKYQNADYSLRMELRRSASDSSKLNYQHIPINTICRQHRTLRGHQVPLQPLHSSTEFEEYSEEVTTNALGRRNAFLVKKIKSSDFSHSLTSFTNLETSLDLWFPCWNKCGTSTFSEVLTTSGKFTKEAGRTIYLSISLEKSTGNQTIEVAEELKINIWSKEGLCERDLKKTVIRMPKGAAAVVQKSRPNRHFLASFKRRLPSFTSAEKEEIRNLLNKKRRSSKR